MVTLPAHLALTIPQEFTARSARGANVGSGDPNAIVGKPRSMTSSGASPEYVDIGVSPVGKVTSQ
jgi:hypothetical protein